MYLSLYFPVPPPIPLSLLPCTTVITAAWQNLSTLGGNSRNPGHINLETGVEGSGGGKKGSGSGKKGAGGAPQALLPKQSLSAVAVHCGGGSLYAVAHSTMVIGAGGSMVGCEGITLLPPGARWLTLALGCICVDTSSLLSDFRGEGDCDVLGEEYSMTTHQMVTRGKTGGKRGKNSDMRRAVVNNSRSDIVPYVNYPPTGIGLVAGCR